MSSVSIIRLSALLCAQFSRPYNRKGAVITLSNFSYVSFLVLFARVRFVVLHIYAEI
jgi:hypothetical protein